MQSGQFEDIAGATHSPKVKYFSHSLSSLLRTTPPSQSEISTNTPKCQYYQPQEDQETYYINSEGHLQCHQDPQRTIIANSPQELHRSQEHPIYPKPGSVIVSSVEDLQRFYPNLFDRLGSHKGEHNIKGDPTVPPVQHARRKVLIESKAAINETIEYMISKTFWSHRLSQHLGYLQSVIQ